MASRKFYFFTDANAQAASASAYLDLQTGAEAFGPATSNTAGHDEYRVTSLHKATGFDPTAYAVCDGMICVQPVDATRVNLILKPLVQPPLNFAPVKYIIYKGILASSLIAGAEVAPVTASSNDLVKAIQAIQAKKNQSAGTSQTAPKEALGIGLTGTGFADTDPIDNLFFRSAVSFQPPTVSGGWSLGSFDRTGFGLEILMEGLNFRHDLKLARRIESRISVPELVTGANDAQLFEHWHDKEQVLGFMDPCAFFGSFFRAGVAARTSTATAFADKAGARLYNDVIFPFANRNKAYLDIRNEHNFSFNYFRNYGTTMRLSTKTAPVDYYAGGWPILVLTAADFAAGNTTTARNGFGLQLPVGDNPRPLVFVSHGYRDINRKGAAFPAELKSAERFFDAFDNPVGGYTVPKQASGSSALILAVPNVSGLAATTPVSCYIRLKYLKQEQGTTTVPTVIQAANYLDNLIWPLEMVVQLSDVLLTRSVVFPEEVYVNGIGVAGLDSDFIASVGIGRDSDNSYMFLVPTVVRTNNGRASAQVSLVGESSKTAGGYPDQITSKYDSLRLRKTSLALSSTTTVPVAELISDAAPGAGSQFDVPDTGKLLVVAVGNATYDAWKASMQLPSAPLDARFRIYLGVKTIHSGMDTAGVSYKSYELVLRGFKLASTGDSFEVREMNSGADGLSNAVAYALNGPPITCVISSGADGKSTVCVPVNGAIQLQAVPSAGGGSYQWTTSSPRITLINPTSQTVTVAAKGTVSTGRGAEEVSLVFTPVGSAALPPVIRRVTVVKVTYSASAVQNYGYDDMDNDPGVNHHLSVKRLGSTTVHVDILGGGIAEDLEFTSDDPLIAQPVAPTAGSGASFELVVQGMNQNKAQTSIRAKCLDGAICATIEVNVYKEVALTFKVAKLWDSTNPATALSFPNLDMVATTALINGTYKSVVAKITLQDSSPTGGAIDLNYDKDNSGTLTLGVSGTGADPDFIRATLGLVPGTEQYQILVIRALHYVYFLAKPALAGDTTVVLRTGANIFFSQNILDGSSYDLGPGAGTETVTIVSRDYANGVDVDGDGGVDGINFTLAAPLSNNHPTSQGIIRPVAGVRTAPIAVLEQASQAETQWVIAHEIGHVLDFDFSDLDALTDLMNFSTAFTDHRLRFKPQPLHYKPGVVESQWEKVPRG